MAFEHLDRSKFADERMAIAAALATRPLSQQDREAVRGEAEALVRAARKTARRKAWSKASSRNSACPPARAWP
jgi:RHH-type proline utilization regulon transcriptional repressor/proline dehydrogenase/delta 1-pyrroline-5-carboxylate dehydrogenase